MSLKVCGQLVTILDMGPILAILNLHVDLMPPTKFRYMVQEEMLFEEFKDGCHYGHLGYQNETILAINDALRPSQQLWSCQDGKLGDVA